MTLLPARPTDFPLPGQSVTPPEWTINWAFIALFIPLIIEHLPCFPQRSCLSIAATLLSDASHSWPQHSWNRVIMLKYQAIPTSSYFIISWLPIMPYIYFWCQLLAHRPQLPLKSNQINTTVSFPSIQRTVLVLLSAISSSMFSCFCYLIATYQAIYLFLLL